MKDLRYDPNQFHPPFRLGRKNKRAILDAKGQELAIMPHKNEIQAQLYVDYLNGTKTIPESISDLEKEILDYKRISKQLLKHRAHSSEKIDIIINELNSIIDDIEKTINKIKNKHLC